MPSFSIHRMPDDNLAGALAMAVDAAVPLLHYIRVIRYFEVDHQMAVVLEINALRSSVGRQQYPHRGIRGVGLERGFHALAFFRVHTAVDECQTLSTEAVGCEDPLFVIGHWWLR